jgi:hypothetical protein
MVHQEGFENKPLFVPQSGLNTQDFNPGVVHRLKAGWAMVTGTSSIPTLEGVIHEVVTDPIDSKKVFDAKFNELKSTGRIHYSDVKIMFFESGVLYVNVNTPDKNVNVHGLNKGHTKTLTVFEASGGHHHLVAQGDGLKVGKNR